MVEKVAVVAKVVEVVIKMVVVEVKVVVVVTMLVVVVVQVIVLVAKVVVAVLAMVVVVLVAKVVSGKSRCPLSDEAVVSCRKMGLQLQLLEIKMMEEALEILANRCRRRYGLR